MAIKRKRDSESPSKSEFSAKIRRINTNDNEREGVPIVASPPPSDSHQDRQEVEKVPDTNTPPLPLTRKNLRQLETMTGAKKSNTASSGSSDDKSETTNSEDKKTKSHFSTTDTGFEERLRENGVVNPFQSAMQGFDNETALHKYLAKSRASNSPTMSQYQRFAEDMQNVENEKGVEKVMSRYVLKDAEGDLDLRNMKYISRQDRQWLAFPKDVGFNNGLAAPKPDLVEGFNISTFPPTVRELGGSATLVPGGRIALPHFAMEFKNIGKDMHQAGFQAGYDGAAMVYGRNNALKHIDKKKEPPPHAAVMTATSDGETWKPPSHAAVMTATSDGETWKAYAHYAHKNEETGETEYHQHAVGAGQLQTYGSFKSGRKSLRNLQDYARDQSKDLRDSLQKHYDKNGSISKEDVSKKSTSKKSTSKKSASKESASDGAGSKKSASKRSASEKSASNGAASERSISTGGTDIIARASGNKVESPTSNKNPDKEKAVAPSDKRAAPLPAFNKTPDKGKPVAKSEKKASVLESSKIPDKNQLAALPPPPPPPRKTDEARSRPRPNGTSQSSGSGRTSRPPSRASAASSDRDRYRDHRPDSYDGFNPPPLQTRRSDSPKRDDVRPEKNRYRERDGEMERIRYRERNGDNESNGARGHNGGRQSSGDRERDGDMERIRYRERNGDNESNGARGYNGGRQSSGDREWNGNWESNGGRERRRDNDTGYADDKYERRSEVNSSNSLSSGTNGRNNYVSEYVKTTEAGGKAKPADLGSLYGRRW